MVRDFHRNIGAEIMGRNKFGPQSGAWADHEWKGWWGDVPPFHTPVFVLTPHVRPSFTLADTTFHFIDASPADALAQAKAAADGTDVRCGCGVHTVREFLDPDLIDTLHVAVAPLDLGRGERLWELARRAPRQVPLRPRPQPQRSHPPLLAPLDDIPDSRSARAGSRADVCSPADRDDRRCSRRLALE